MLEAYARGELDEPLYDVTVKKGDTVLANGHGRLLISDDNRVAIDLYSKGIIRERWNDFKPGEMYTLDDMPVLEATTDRGCSVAMRGAEPGPPGGSTDAGFSRMRFRPFEIELRFDEKVDFTPAVKGIITPFATDVSNSCSHVKDDNPFFGHEGGGRDWLRVQSDGATAALRKGENDRQWFAFAAKQGETADVVKHSEAFLTALSFVVGESVSWLAFITYSGTSEIIRLRQPSRKRKGILNQPLPARPFQETETELLAKATTFFYDKPNSRVGHLLGICWDVLGGYCHSEYAVVCIVVEALSNFVIEKFMAGETPEGMALKDESEQLDKFKPAAIAAIRNCDQIDQQKDARSIARVTKWIESMSIRQSPKGETIETAIQLINSSRSTKIDISRDEIGAWKKLRDCVTHGEFRTGPDSIADFPEENHQFDCCVNIINKLVLGLIGYTGPFRDYSKPNYPNGMM